MRDRVSWIVLRGMLLLLSAGSLVAVPVNLLSALSGESLYWRGHVGYVTAFDSALVHPASGAALTWDGDLGVRLGHSSWQLRLLAALPDLLVGLGIAYVAGALLLVVMNTQAGRPFAGRTASVLQSTAGAMALVAVAAPLARAWANQRVLDRALVLDPTAGAPPVGFEVDVEQVIVWLLVSLLVLVAARAFREGSRLAEDVKGLV